MLEDDEKPIGSDVVIPLIDSVVFLLLVVLLFGLSTTVVKSLTICDIRLNTVFQGSG